ncbi:hypothetical protein PRUPE_8G174100 [Prunus persica]|uniref:NAD(P)-binding domain-containing protein n=1 Tax=Prunus persica TaxID=3760 RepID=M5VI94_PRUPE|nr:hypothetical protein PRUPE_8G174100 [Prunus persica]
MTIIFLLCPNPKQIGIHNFIYHCICDSSLKPIFRARTVSDAPPFDPSNIVSLQLMFSKFEFDGKLNPTFVEQAFKLPLSSIRAYLKEPIAPRISLLVFRVVLEQGGDLVRESGVPYTIVRPCALTEEPAGQISSPNCTCYVYQEIRLCYDVVKKMRLTELEANEGKIR